MTIYKVEKGCILCQGDVIGNEKQGYLCKRCNILYSEENLVGKEKTEYKDFNPKKHEEDRKENEEGFQKRRNKYHPPKGSGWNKTII